MLYVKDWHLWKDHERLFSESLYDLPPFFSDDWLELYSRSFTDDDYRFVYLGPRGSWTAVHADVLRSYSWSYNVVGKKEWLFFPPSSESELRDAYFFFARGPLAILPLLSERHSGERGGSSVEVVSAWVG